MQWIWEWNLLLVYIICVLNLCFQLEEKYIVEIFCEMNMDEFEIVVGELFIDFVFEVMEKIINVSLEIFFI